MERFEPAALLEITRSAIRRGANINKVIDGEVRSGVLSCTKTFPKSYSTIINVLLYAIISQKDRTLVHMSALLGNIESLTELLAAGADPDSHSDVRCALCFSENIGRYS